MTSAHFEYNTLRSCIVQTQRQVHRFGTPDSSNCACGEYLRSQEPNPAWKYIKSSLEANVSAPTNQNEHHMTDVVFNSKERCDSHAHRVPTERYPCQCEKFFFCRDSLTPCLNNVLRPEHYFPPASLFCNCNRYRQRESLAPPTKHTAIDRAWLIDFFEKTTARMVDTMKKKNADYGGAVPDPFSNFVQVETLGIATAEQGFLTRMTDKLCRVASFAKNGELQVKDESVSDTLLDLANYSLLMMAYLEAKRARQ